MKTDNMIYENAISLMDSFEETFGLTEHTEAPIQIKKVHDNGYESNLDIEKVNEFIKNETETVIFEFEVNDVNVSVLGFSKVVDFDSINITIVPFVNHEAKTIEWLVLEETNNIVMNDLVLEDAITYIKDNIHEDYLVDDYLEAVEVIEEFYNDINPHDRRDISETLKEYVTYYRDALEKINSKHVDEILCDIKSTIGELVSQYQNYDNELEDKLYDTRNSYDVEIFMNEIDDTYSMLIEIQRFFSYKKYKQ